jgi:hypothetical protein
VKNFHHQPPKANTGPNHPITTASITEMEDTIVVSKKSVGETSEDMDNHAIDERDDATESFTAKLKAAFQNRPEKEEEGAIKIDSEWKYEKTRTRMKGDPKTAEQATTLEGVLQSISCAFELLSNQRTRGLPEIIKHEVMQRLKNTYTDLKPLVTKSAEVPQTRYTDTAVLDVLKELKTNVAKLEDKYDSIESIIKQEHEAIQATMKEVPKTFATAVSNRTTDEKAAEMRARQRQHREKVRNERAKYEVTLTTKEASDETKKLIATMAPKEIMKCCQDTIEKAAIPDIKLKGVNKLVNGFRIKCATEEQAKRLRMMDWSNFTFENVKLHRRRYGVVAHGIAIDALDLTDNNRTNKTLEDANDLENGTIIKVIPLRRKNKASPERTHHSIVIFMNNPTAANKCIENGCLLDSEIHTTVRFTPQYQVTQCFNCYDFGHCASQCKRNPRCGKCGENHNTRECTNTTIKCACCKGGHQAWHRGCPAYIAESDRIEEARDNAPDLYPV